jgi:hypothetical protein
MTSAAVQPDYFPMPHTPNTFDKRLIGAWRSDRRRTMKEWVFPVRWTPTMRRRLAGIFGHLLLRYTRSRMHSDFQGHCAVRAYKVLASDSDSVAILHWDDLLGEQRVKQLHFEGRHYWISLGRNREFFKKIEPSETAVKSKVVAPGRQSGKQRKTNASRRR